MEGGVGRESGANFSSTKANVGGTDAPGGGDAEKNFERVKAQLKARLGAEVYSSWFGRMKLAEASKGVVRLSVPTAFLRSWINGHYLDQVTEFWKQGDATLLKLEIVVRSSVRPGR
ncbi:MAG: chromosomal replication initiator protein DnaA, partial [Rhizobiaceae bacterium]|nr:chromosomal replication initiator protein DnaA [Rhizobiaceae bacterium]